MLVALLYAKGHCPIRLVLEVTLFYFYMSKGFFFVFGDYILETRLDLIQEATKPIYRLFLKVTLFAVSVALCHMSKGCFFVFGLESIK